jgi:DNA-binding winged helix-turn-helix (wHTH) protein/tetratricopeptide (TPR) repeat protein
MIYRFGRFELDEEAGELRSEGRAVEIQPKPLALLRILLRERHRVVSADELFEELWPGTAVTPSSLTRAVSTARRAIGDTHRGDVLKSFSRRGYRFVGDAVAIAGPGAPAAPVAPGAAARPRGSPFVGRDAALAELRRCWSEASAGRGQLALVVGPAGIGKTRLAEVFAAEVERSGGLVAIARGRDGEGVPGFWVWAQVLRRLFELDWAGEALRPLLRDSVEIAGLVPGLEVAAGAGADRSAEQSRFLFFDGVARALASVSRRRPVLVVLEDAQWAKSPSLRLLEHLAYELPGAAVCVVATVRAEPRPADHPIERSLPLLRQLPGCSEVRLGAFSRREVAALLERVIERPAPADLTSTLYARTEGVPLFLREAIRLLENRGELRQPERVRHWAVALPPHAFDLIRRPLDALPPEAAAVVAAGAVLGREFTSAAVAAVADVSREAALDALDQGVRAGVIEAAPDAPGSWRFAHALFQEAACAGLAPGARARLHARAADHLEQRHADELDAVIAEVAQHRHGALALGDAERAGAAALRAAERATRLLAHEQAVVHYEQALAALDHSEVVDTQRKLDTLLALGESLRHAGDRERRREAFGRAVALAGELDRPLALARAAIGFCDLTEWAPQDAAGRQALQQALAALGPGPSPEAARLDARLAYLEVRNGAAAETAARRAVLRARASGDPTAIVEALYVLQFLIGAPHRFEERNRLQEELVKVGRDSPLRETAVIASIDRASDWLSQGDLAASRRARADAAELAGDRPHLALAWHLRTFDAGMALLEGRFDDAAALADEALAAGRRVEHPYAPGVHVIQCADLLRDRGQPERVVELVKSRLPVTRWLRAQVGCALAELDRPDEARAALLELAGDGVPDVRPAVRYTKTLVEIANLCADLGAEALAASLLEKLAPVAEQHAVLPVPVCYGGPVSRAIARLEALLGDFEAADAHFDQALAQAEDLGARPMQARILVEHGALGLRRGDRRAGHPRLERGLALARALGMPRVEAQAAAGLARAAR